MVKTTKITKRKKQSKKQTKKKPQINIWGKMKKKIKKKEIKNKIKNKIKNNIKKNNSKSECTYYIVQHGEGYSVPYSRAYNENHRGYIGNFDNIFPVIKENFEIIRIVPPMWVMMSNLMVNENLRKLLNNGIGKNFWKLWNRQFSKIRDAAPKQNQERSEDDIGVVQMNQMPLMSKTMQVFEKGNRYYNEMLKHDVDGDFGIWKKCEGSKEWTCIFDKYTMGNLQKNNSTMYNLLYNGTSNIKTYSMRSLINLLWEQEDRGHKKRFIFASCSPLQTFDRYGSMPLKNYKRLPTDSSDDSNYWYGRLIELQYRIFIYVKGNAMFITKMNNLGSNNTLDYENIDLGEVIAIAENDEIKDIETHFTAFFRWLEEWDEKFYNFTINGIKFTAVESIIYILKYLKRDIYNIGGIAPKIRITKKMDPNSSYIYNQLKLNHEEFKNIFEMVEGKNVTIQSSNTSSYMGDKSPENMNTTSTSPNNSLNQYMMLSNTPTD